MTNENGPNNDKYDVPISGHEYDGITELDNPLPDWWLYVFLGTIIFGALYWVHYQSGSGKTNDEQLAESLKEIQVLQAQENQGPGYSESDLIALQGETLPMANAAQNFSVRCAVCHGGAGEGGIGPSLIDDVWIHGGDLVNIYQVIQDGALDKGMPPWRGILSSEEVAEMTAYVKSMSEKVVVE